MIYLDYNATTSLDPAVADAMRPFLTGRFGNPSSSHVAGREARAAVEAARASVAALIGAAPPEVVFTSGGSESNNAAIKGVAVSRPGGHFVTTVVEHSATLAPMRFLERFDFQRTEVRVDRYGMVDPA